MIYPRTPLNMDPYTNLGVYFKIFSIVSLEMKRKIRILSGCVHWGWRMGLRLMGGI